MMRWLLLAAALVACDGANDNDTVKTPAGVLEGRSIAVEACNDVVQTTLVFQFAATEDVVFSSASISGMPIGDGTKATVATVPADHTFVVRCIAAENVPGLEMPEPSQGTATVDFTLAVDGDALTARVEVPFTTGVRAFDNCGNVLGAVGCTLADP